MPSNGDWDKVCFSRLFLFNHLSYYPYGFTDLTLMRTNPEELRNAAIEKERHMSQMKIAKPAGQAGCRSGYTLQRAMGIEQDHFLRILVCYYSIHVNICG